MNLESNQGVIYLTGGFDDVARRKGTRRLRVCVFAILVLLAFGATALESTGTLEVEHARDRAGAQKSLIELEFEFSQDVRQAELTSVLVLRSLHPDDFETNKSDQQFLSNGSKRWYPNDNFELDLREFYLDMDLAISSLQGRARLGKQQVVWGQADGLRLLDVVNPIDFREFILDDYDDSRIPLWMANLELFFAFGDLQILWIPDTSVHDIPGIGSTYALTAPFANFPSNLDVILLPAARPDNPWNDADAGLKLSLFADGWDVTLNYLYRYDDFPAFTKVLMGTRLMLTPNYERTHTLGVSASNAFGEVVVRSELVWNSEKFESTDGFAFGGLAASQEIGYVLGLDWNGLTDTLLSVQLFQSILLDDAQGPDEFVRDKVDTNLTFLMRRNFLNESLRFDALWIYHTNDNDNLFRISASYDLTSSFVIEAYADVFTGDADQLFGQFDQNDRLGFKLQYGF